DLIALVPLGQMEDVRKFPRAGLSARRCQHFVGTSDQLLIMQAFGLIKEDTEGNSLGTERVTNVVPRAQTQWRCSIVWLSASRTQRRSFTLWSLENLVAVYQIHPASGRAQPSAPVMWLAIPATPASIVNISFPYVRPF